MPLEPNLVINALSGLLLVAFGIAVGLLRPRRRANLAFAAFCIAFGARVAFSYTGIMLGPSTDAAGVLFGASIACSVVSVVTLPVVAILFPCPLPSADRRLLALPLLVLVAFEATFLTALALNFGPFLDLIAEGTGQPVESLGIEGVELAVTFANIGSFLLFLTLLPLRFAASTGAAHDRDRRQFVLMAAALTLWPGILAGTLVLTTVTATAAAGAVALGSLVMAAMLWVRAAAAGGPDATSARNAALLTLVVPLVGMVLAVATPGRAELVGPQHGIARTLSVLLLGYAILRHQLLGIDVKIKWTLKQSTVAAIFVAVFFAASEGAQSVFEDQWGPFVGIGAAGALVFAIHPLQHLAQRFADQAMPGVAPIGEMTGHQRHRTYHDLAEQAWRDGTLSADERDLLRRARESLGLSASDAEAIEDDIRRAA